MEISEVPCPYCGVMLEKEDPGGDRIFVAECQCKYDWIRCKFCGAPLKPWWDKNSGLYRCTNPECLDPEYLANPLCRTVQKPPETQKKREE